MSEESEQASPHSEPRGLEEDRLEAMLENPKMGEDIARRIKEKEKEDHRQHLTPSGMATG